MSDSHLFKNNGDLDTLILTFASFELNVAGIPRFEFFNFLNEHFKEYDHSFFIDKKYCWYNKGVDGCSDTIESTVSYLENHIKDYKKVVFMGVSAGGYAAMLYASLCKVEGVTHSAVAFQPQTDLSYVMERKNSLPDFVVTKWEDIDERYKNLKDHMRTDVKYDVVSHRSLNDVLHHWHHTENIYDIPSVCFHDEYWTIQELKNSGKIEAILKKSIDG